MEVTNLSKPQSPQTSIDTQYNVCDLCWNEGCTCQEAWLPQGQAAHLHCASRLVTECVRRHIQPQPVRQNFAIYDITPFLQQQQLNLQSSFKVRNLANEQQAMNVFARAQTQCTPLAGLHFCLRRSNSGDGPRCQQETIRKMSELCLFTRLFAFKVVGLGHHSSAWVTFDLSRNSWLWEPIDRSLQPQTWYPKQQV
eukprot:164256-Amphidinium_carterae.5